MMIDQIYITLALFAFLMVGTPGPANMVLMTAGANFGYRKSLPFLVGVITGKLLMNIALGFGLYGFLAAIPYAFDVLKFGSGAYVIYLSYQMSKASFGVKTEGLQKPPEFIPGLAVHPLNPKAYAMLSIAWSSFGPEIEGGLWRVVVISLTFTAVQIIVHNLWCYAGEKLIGLIRKEKQKRLIQQSLAILTALVVIWAILL